MKITFAAVLALGSIAVNDAFVMPSHINQGSGKYVTTTTSGPRTSTTIVSMSDGFSDDFLNALKSSGKKKKADDDDDEEEESSGSSRVKELMKVAQMGGGDETQRMPRAIENPFLNPPPPVTPSQPLAANPDELSVEEQARMFREMMAAQQQGGGTAIPAAPIPAEIPQVQRVAKTDRAGRPVGRNRDADTIANTSDLYFAQLKRDSTVRTMARIRGEIEVAEKVFEDEGIKQLDDLLKKNPYLKG